MRSFTEYINEHIDSEEPQEPEEAPVNEQKGQRTVGLSKTLYKELNALERDTVGEGSPNAKRKLADALEKAKKRGSQMAITVDDEVAKYLKDNSLPNVKDIARDNMNRRIEKAAETVEGKL